MDDNSRFRMVDRNKGEVIGAYPTAVMAFIGFNNIDSEKHPSVRMEIYGVIDSSEGRVGSYWCLGMENLKKLVEHELEETAGSSCL